MKIIRIQIDKLITHLNNGHTLLVPNLRTKDAILDQYFDKHQKTTIPTPVIFPIDIFIKKIWELNARRAVVPCKDLTILSPEQEFLIWDKVIEKSLTTIPLLNVDETSASVSRSYRLARQWISEESFENELKPVGQRTDTIIFYNWIQEFQKSCRDNDLISLVDATASLTNLLSMQKIRDLPENIVLVNFHQAPPLYTALFNALPETISLSTSDVLLNPRQDKKPLIKSRDIEQEIQTCVKWAKQTCQNSPNSHIGILVPDKEIYRSKLERALKKAVRPDSLYDDVSINTLFNSTTTNRRLIDSALIYDAFLILNLSKADYSIHDMIRLLQSPFILVVDNGDNSLKQGFSELYNSLRKLSVKNISNREFLRLLEGAESTSASKELASRLVNIRTRLRRMRKHSPPIEWAQYFEDTLQDFGWPGTSEMRTHTDLLNQWNDIISAFKSTSGIFSNLDFPSALRALRKLATLTPQSNYFDTRLQISFFSINEAVGLEYDYVWMLGMSDSHWPKPANPSPFIPYSLQTSTGMPGSESSLEMLTARSNLDQVFSSTNFEILASYHATDGNQSYQQSQMLSEFNFYFSENERSDSAKDINLSDTIEIEHIFNESLPINEDEVVTGGAELISDQSRCPFKAFALQRLQVYPDPSLTIGVDKMTKGTALHIALEKLFTNISSSESLHSLSDLEINSYIEEASQNAVRFLSIKLGDIATPAIQKIEHLRISSLLEKFINHEKDQPSFKIVSQEQKISSEFGNIKLNLRIDRIDQVNGYGFALIDYKSGKYAPSSNDWSNERPSDMQLPLYYTVCTEGEFKPLTAVLIANLNIEIKSIYSGESSKDGIKTDIRAPKSKSTNDSSWNEITNQWSRKVERLTADLNNGECDVNPINSSDTCKMCGLQALCRKHELISVYKKSHEDTN